MLNFNFQVLRLVHYLVKYGYYGHIEDIKKLLVPLLSLLDGRNDKPYPIVKGTALIVCILRYSGKQVIKVASIKVSLQTHYYFQEFHYFRMC